MLPALLYPINQKTRPNKTRIESKSRIPCGLSGILVLLDCLLIHCHLLAVQALLPQKPDGKAGNSLRKYSTNP